MKNYGRIQGASEPPAIEMTENAVFVASNVQPYTETVEDYTINGYEYDYVEYTKDEYLIRQNEKITSLEEELKAAKILLGVD